eukprot:SAG31_NODE_10064_length_1188_cov_1.644628_3_plen_48_part_01
MVGALRVVGKKQNATYVMFELDGEEFWLTEKDTSSKGLEFQNPLGDSD